MKILILTEKSTLSMLQVTQEHLQKIKNSQNSLEVILLQSPSNSRLKKELLDTDILLPMSGMPPFNLLANIKWIHISSAGADALSSEIKNSPIMITNSSGVHPIPIAEHVLGCMLMFARQLHTAYRMQVLDKKWRRGSAMPFELYGSTAVIVGLGRIGSRIAMLAKACGMHVFAITRSKRGEEKFVDQLHTYKDMDKVLSKADFVINALPATAETADMFDAAKFAHMKPTAYFINIGRGKTVVEKDLISVLKKKKIAGAALDVFQEEPLPQTNPLWNLDNIILTPHVSGFTPHYTDRVIDIFCLNLKQYLTNKPLPNLVDKQKGY